MNLADIWGHHTSNVVDAGFSTHLALGHERVCTNFQGHDKRYGHDMCIESYDTILPHDIIWSCP